MSCVICDFIRVCCKGGEAALDVLVTEEDKFILRAAMDDYSNEYILK